MKKKILFVEDNDDMRLLYEILFRKAQDIQIQMVDNAESALYQIQEIKPDLMVIDISLPDMNGLELSQKVHQKSPDIKILIVTAHEPSRYYDEAKKAGAQDIISKDIGRGLVDRCKELLF